MDVLGALAIEREPAESVARSVGIDASIVAQLRLSVSFL
jgi:hypothetical protein